MPDWRDILGTVGMIGGSFIPGLGTVAGGALGGLAGGAAGSAIDRSQPASSRYVRPGQMDSLLPMIQQAAQYWISSGGLSRDQEYQEWLKKMTARPMSQPQAPQPMWGPGMLGPWGRS